MTKGDISKSPHPFISIVIPTINEAATIVHTLNTLQYLRKERCEIIVADGGSSDSTVDLALPLSDKVINTPKGRSKQMNAGAHQASGKWLVFLHADTFLPTSILQLSTLLKSNKYQWGFFALRLSGKSNLFRIIERAISIRSRVTSIATGDQVLFVQNDLFNKCGYFPDYALMEDVAITKQLRKNSKPLFWRDPVITSSRRWEQKGVIRTVLLMWYLRLAFFLGAKPDYLEKIYYGK